MEKRKHEADPQKVDERGAGPVAEHDVEGAPVLQKTRRPETTSMGRRGY